MPRPTGTRARPDPPARSWRAKFVRSLRLVVVNLAIFVILMLVIEGFASYVAVVRDARRVYHLAERSHTRHDPELGWVNRPDVTIDDMYGPGVDLRINHQGFRADHEFDPVVPAGRSRAICAGDSFTFGYGVANDETWCQLLTDLEPGLETVNLALGAYGAGQAYLAYRREAAELEHHLTIFAFITDDFNRLPAKSLYGYSKPVLEIVDGSLEVSNVPVPPPYSLTWRWRVAQKYARRLHTVALVRGWLGIDAPAGPAPARGSSDGRGEASWREARIRAVLAKLIEELDSLAARRSSRLLLVYFPIQSELDGDRTEPWRAFVTETARSLDVPLLDTFPAFRALPSEERAAMYIPEGQVAYPASAGHFSRRGNEFVAGLIHASILADPELSRAIDPPGF